MALRRVPAACRRLLPAGNWGQRGATSSPTSAAPLPAPNSPADFPCLDPCAHRPSPPPLDPLLPSVCPRHTAGTPGASAQEGLWCLGPSPWHTAGMPGACPTVSVSDSVSGALPGALAPLECLRLWQHQPGWQRQQPGWQQHPVVPGGYPASPVLSSLRQFSSGQGQHGERQQQKGQSGQHGQQQRNQHGQGQGQGKGGEKVWESTVGVPAAAQRRKQEAARAQLLYLSALVIAMVGLSYAAVPLYRMFCQATGFGGTTQRKETVESKLGKGKGGAKEGEEDSVETDEERTAKAAAKRQLVVYFNADVADGLPWKFTPCQKELRLRPGQSTLAFYTAHNRSTEPITGVSTYNVSPMKAGIYFNKIQCFCFEEQRLQPGEKIDMPVFFYIDPEFAVDPNMDDVTNLTLSYTFFKVSS